MRSFKVYQINLWLLLAFVGTVITGFGFHISGHNGIELHTSHLWASCHIISALIFSWLGIIHIKQHWFWYKKLLDVVKGKKTITLILSSLLIFEIVSGLLLLVFGFLEGGICGHLHWIAGELLMVFGVIHIINHRKPLNKAVVNLCKNSR